MGHDVGEWKDLQDQLFDNPVQTVQADQSKVEEITYGQHTVAAGETLQGIALKYGASVAERESMPESGHQKCCRRNHHRLFAD